jgi:hypothetical protein
MRPVRSSAGTAARRWLRSAPRRGPAKCRSPRPSVRRFEGKAKLVAARRLRHRGVPALEHAHSWRNAQASPDSTTLDLNPQVPSKPFYGPEPDIAQTTRGSALARSISVEDLFAEPVELRLVVGVERNAELLE